MSLKTVVVVGASGLQGSSVVAEFLKYPNDYRVRGLTRDPSKPAALALSANGVDVQAADPNAGKLVYAVVENRKSYLEKAIAFYAQALSEGEKLAQLSKELGVTFEYRKSTFGQFQKRLEDAGMIPELALDFTEQLLIFEYFGNIYASHDFVQATEIPGLSLKTWEEFIQENKEELRSKIASANAPSPWGLRLAEEP
ncbi:hypothetical protein FP744_10007701 [Trichoderma asperellum]